MAARPRGASISGARISRPFSSVSADMIERHQKMPKADDHDLQGAHGRVPVRPSEIFVAPWAAWIILIYFLINYNSRI